MIGRVFIDGDFATVARRDVDLPADAKFWIAKKP
jgi:hypothetical protein